MHLTRTQKRLLWVLRNYEKRDPFAALYTWVVISRLYAETSPFTGGTPSVLELFRLSGGSAPGPPFGPPTNATLGAMTGWTLGYAHARIESHPWRDTACAKMIPALARWISHELLRFEGGGLRVWWDTPWTEIGEFSLMTAPSSTFLQWIGELTQAFQYVCDWYTGERPDLNAYATWEQARAAATAWHETLGGDAGRRVEQGPVVFQWPDGWSVQALTDLSMFREEGASLAHCIAQSPDYWYAYERGDSAYYSLRTPTGQPWFTIEVDAPGGGYGARLARRGLGVGDAVVTQIKGCKNRIPATTAASRDCPPPDPTECTRIWDFLARTDWHVGPDYAACWGYTAASLGLPPVVQQRSPAYYPATELVRPPSPVAVPEGNTTDRFKADWWD